MKMTKYNKEMLLLTLTRIQYIPKTLSDESRLQEFLHLIDAGGFVIEEKNPEPKKLLTIKDIDDQVLADLRNKLTPAKNLAAMVLNRTLDINNVSDSYLYSEAKKVINMINDITKADEK